MRLNTIVRFFTTITVTAILGFSLNARAEQTTTTPEITAPAPTGPEIVIPAPCGTPDVTPVAPTTPEVPERTAPPIEIPSTPASPPEISFPAPCGNEYQPMEPFKGDHLALPAPISTP